MCVYEKYINPFADFGFKKIFGDPNDILSFEGEPKAFALKTGLSVDEIKRLK